MLPGSFGTAWVNLSHWVRMPAIPAATSGSPGDRNSAPPNTWGEGHISARYGPGNERQAPEGSYPGRLALRG